MNVGWINVFSTYSSKNKLITSPLVCFVSSGISIPFSFASATASSLVSIWLKSIPHASFIESIIVILFQPGAKSISFPWYVTFVVPKTSILHLVNISSVIFIISL